MVIKNKDDMDKCGVYLIKNLVNGCVYVGCTRTTFNHRYKTHLWALENNRHENKHLQSAFNKYKDENFEFSIIEIIENKDEIYNSEIRIIKEYKDKGFSLYNITSGGEGLNDLPEETRKYIGELNRIRMTGQKLSEETKRKMSESRKGRKMSEKSRQRLMEYNKNKTLTQEQKQHLSNMFKGENSNLAKFKNEDILEIKTLLMNGVCVNEIADQFNTSPEYIKSIEYERRWKHIYPDGWEEYTKTLKHKNKISNDIKCNIYNDYYNNRMKKCEIAKKYHVSYDTINRIINT